MELIQGLGVHTVHILSRVRMVAAERSADIAQRKQAEEELAHRALHDPLTDLPNRMLFMDRLSHALVGAQRRPGSIAVLFLDLDRFKVINDTFGHDGGDRVLVGVASGFGARFAPGTRHLASVGTSSSSCART